MVRPEVSFHTAGQPLSHDGSHIIVNQTYVQYIPPIHAPETITNPSIPILFVHGGALTGAMWESTPDRRPGWALLASRPPHSRPTYLLDVVDSGRSQRCPGDCRPGPLQHKTAATCWATFRFGRIQDYIDDNVQSSKVFGNLQFPIEHFENLLAAQSAKRRSTEQYEAEAQGLRDAVAEIGECDVVSHSNGCLVTNIALLDEGTRAKIGRLVMVEPGWPLPQALNHLALVKTCLVWGDNFAEHKLWASIRDCYANMSGDVTVWNLPEMGMRGNSHFPMHDRNSDEVGSLVLKWLRGS